MRAPRDYSVLRSVGTVDDPSKEPETQSQGGGQPPQPPEPPQGQGEPSPKAPDPQPYRPDVIKPSIGPVGPDMKSMNDWYNQQHKQRQEALNKQFADRQKEERSAKPDGPDIETPSPDTPAPDAPGGDDPPIDPPTTDEMKIEEFDNYFGGPDREPNPGSEPQLPSEPNRPDYGSPKVEQSQAEVAEVSVSDSQGQSEPPGRSEPLSFAERHPSPPGHGMEH